VPHLLAAHTRYPECTLYIYNVPVIRGYQLDNSNFSISSQPNTYCIRVHRGVFYAVFEGISICARFVIISPRIYYRPKTTRPPRIVFERSRAVRASRRSEESPPRRHLPLDRAGDTFSPSFPLVRPRTLSLHAGSTCGSPVWIIDFTWITIEGGTVA